MLDERAHALDPVVPEAVAHNAKVLTQLRSLSASVFGVAAGVLGLEALWGFAFYAVGMLMMSALVALFLAGGVSKVPLYFEDGRAPRLNEGKGERGMRSWEGGWGWGIWTRDLTGGLMSYVLTWTLFYGLLRS